MNILFMCVANSARSQLAEGLARCLFPSSEIKSAGSDPGKLNPLAVKVMYEIGVDISKSYSKSYDDLSPKFIVNLDYVITLCAEEVCPVLSTPHAKKLHWPFPDPAATELISEEETLTRFRAVRNGILIKLKEFEMAIVYDL